MFESGTPIPFPDELGRPISRLIDGYGISSLTYDALGRLEQEVNEVGTFSYSYDGVTSRLESATYPNGQTSSYSYFGNGVDRRLQTIHHRNSTTETISRFDYTYNAVGDILTWRQQADSTANQWEYAYDAADQLIGAIKKSTGSPATVLKRYAYTYDRAGNRTVEQVDDVVVGTTHDSLNRLLAQAPNGIMRVAGSLNEAGTVTVAGSPAVVATDNSFEGAVLVSAGTTSFSISATDANNNVTTNQYEVENTGSSKTFTYDDNGNMTSDGTRTFEWDAKNRLMAVESGTHRSEFSYDGLDRRVRIVEKEENSVVRDARFIWVGTAIAEERLSTGAITRFFHNSEEHDGVARYLTRDHLGSIRELTDSSEEILTRNDYDPYGRITRVSGSEDSRFGFTGHYQHEISGLILAPYRAYHPDLGRWISEDPKGFIDGPNLHRYSHNNGITMYDPTGNIPIAITLPVVIGGIVSGPWGWVAAIIVTATVTAAVADTYARSKNDKDEDAREHHFNNPPPPRTKESYKPKTKNVDDAPTAEDNFNDITKTQDRLRKTGRPDQIGSTKKSRQRADKC